MRPRDAKTEDELCSLNTDNKNVENGWILADQEYVILCNQKPGENSTGQVKFKRKEFNRLIDWYNRDQKIKPN